MLTRLAGAPLLFAVLFSAAGSRCSSQLGARLQSDGFYYFAYLRSLAFDRDVDFSNDYRLLGLGDKTHLFQPTPTGHAQSAWTIGPAIVWSPFFAAGHVVATRLRASTSPTSAPTASRSRTGRRSASPGLFYGLLGCWFALSARAARVFDRRDGRGRRHRHRQRIVHALVPREGTEHDARAVDGAGRRLRLGVGGDAGEPRHAAQWALLGLLAGFMTLIRWQNALFALLPACDAAAALCARRGGDRDPQPGAPRS